MITTNQLLDDVLGQPEAWLALPALQRVSHALDNGLVDQLLTAEDLTREELLTIARSSPQRWADAALHQPADDELAAELLTGDPTEGLERLQSALRGRLNELHELRREDPRRAGFALPRALLEALAAAVLADLEAVGVQAVEFTAARLRWFRSGVAALFDPADLVTLAPYALAVAATLDPDQDDPKLVNAVASIIERLPTEQLGEQLPAWLLRLALGRDDLPAGLRAALLQAHLLQPLADAADREDREVDDERSRLLWQCSSELTDAERDACAQLLVGLDLRGRREFLRQRYLEPAGLAVTRQDVRDAAAATVLDWQERGHLNAEAVGAAMRRHDLAVKWRMRHVRAAPLEDQLALLGDLLEITWARPGPAARQVGTPAAKLAALLSGTEGCAPLEELGDDTVIELAHAITELPTQQGYTRSSRFWQAGNWITACGRPASFALHLPIRPALLVAQSHQDVAVVVRRRVHELTDEQQRTLRGLADDVTGSLHELLDLAAAVRT